MTEEKIIHKAFKNELNIELFKTKFLFIIVLGKSQLCELSLLRRIFVFKLEFEAIFSSNDFGLLNIQVVNFIEVILDSELGSSHLWILVGVNLHLDEVEVLDAKLLPLLIGSLAVGSIQCDTTHVLLELWFEVFNI